MSVIDFFDVVGSVGTGGGLGVRKGMPVKASTYL